MFSELGDPCSLERIPRVPSSGSQGHLCLLYPLRIRGREEARAISAPISGLAQ